MDKITDTDIDSFIPTENDEFGIYTDLADLPVSGYPSYLKEGVGAACTQGSASIQVFNTKFRIMPDMVVTLLP